MNILIFDANGNLVRFIPSHSIVRICWRSENGKGGYEILNHSPDTLHAVNNSARKLAHAIVSGADRVCLDADEMLQPALFSRWCEQVEDKPIGYLPEARMPFMGGAA